MAAVLAETHADVFAAVGIHSGLPHGAARDVASAFAAMRGQGPRRRPRRTPGAADHRLSRHRRPHRAAPATPPPSPRRLGGAAAATAGDRRHRRPQLAPQPWRRGRAEVWLVEGAGHAWSGGHPSGSFTDPAGPDASAEMLRFFLA